MTIRQLFHAMVEKKAMTKKASLVFLLLFFVIISLSACSEGETSSIKTSSEETLHACQLLTKDEIQTLIGEGVEPQENHIERADSNQWTSMCDYYSPVKNLGMGVMIMPHGHDGSGSDAYDAYEHEMIETHGKDIFEMMRVEGLGDSAGWSNDLKQLVVFKGPFMLIFSADDLELNKQIAQKVLSKLP